MILGITGALGAGKTAVAAMFSRHGFLHINADEIGHLLLEQPSIKKKIIRAFGIGILSGKTIDRANLRSVAFSSHGRREELNRIIHPVIIQKIKSILRRAHGRDAIIDAALLVEAKSVSLVDKVIVVKASRKEREKRLIKERNWTRQEISKVAKSQLSQKKKMAYADWVVDNDGPLYKTKRQVDRILEKIAQTTRMY